MSDEDEKMSNEEMSYEEERSDADEVMSFEDADVDPIDVEDLSGRSPAELIALYLEERQLRRGTYYSTIDQVWRGEGRHVGRGDSHLFEILKRTQPPSFVSPDGANYYDETIRKARGRTFKPAVKPRSSTDTGAGIWPRDIFATHNMSAQVAHLVPASNNHATAYYDVAICALALDERSGWGTIQKAIHGAVPRRLLGLVARATGGRSGTVWRRRHTGIKHSVPNKIRLSGQAECYDRHPCVLIVPALTLDEVKSWNGQGYQAIVMVGPPRDEALDSSGRVITVQSICRSINMIDEGDIARPEQVEAARTLLGQFVLGLAYSLLHRSGTYRRYLSNGQRGELDRRRNVFYENAAEGVVLPAASHRDPDGQGPPLRVRLVSFRGATDAGNDHVAPDPFLLTAKAAVNWSARNNQKLLAGDEPQDDAEGIDEPELYAMEEYLAWHARAIRPPENRAELAAQLGQSRAHQADKVEAPQMTSGLSEAPIVHEK